MAANVIGDIVVQMRADTAQLRSDIAGVTKSLGDLRGAGASVQRIFETFTGISLSNIAGQMAQLAKTAVQMARSAEMAEYAFHNFATRAGIDAANLQRQLLAASGETVNLSDVLQGAARGLQQGLQGDQLVRIMEVARRQSILTGQTVTAAFNDISVAIANQQPRALKQMGIIVDVNEAMKEFAKTQKVNVDMLNEAGRAQAFYNGFVEATKGKLNDLNDAAVKNKEVWERMGTAAVDNLEAMGKSLYGLVTGALTAFIDKVEKAAAAWNKLRPGGPVGGTAPSAPIPTFGMNFVGVPGGTGMLPSRLPPGGGVLTGQTPPIYYDEKKLAITQALIAAQLDLAKATGGAKVAEAAAVLTTATALELIDEELARLPELTAKQIAENRARFAAAETIEQRAAAERDLITIQTTSAARLFELEKKRRDAQAQQIDESIKLFGALDALNVVAERDIDITNKQVQAYQDLLKIQKELRILREVEGAAEPEGGPGPAPRDLLRSMEAAQQVPITNYLRSMNQIDDIAKNLGVSFDRAGAEIAATSKALEDLGRQGITTGAQVEELQTNLARMTSIRNVMEDLFGGLRNSISGMVQGILQGTQTVGQAFANMGRNIAASLVENVVNRGLKFVQDQLEKFINYLITSGLIQKAVGVAIGLIGGAFSSTSSVPVGAAYDMNLPAGQHGGLVTRPTIALVGEAGPEAIIPLSKAMGSLGMTSGADVEVNINVAPGLPVEQRERTGSQGKVIKDIWIGQWRTALASGALDQDFAQSYGLRRQAVGR